MFRTMLAVALFAIAGSASAQTQLTLSNFSGPGPGWTTHTEVLNGGWSLSPIGGSWVQVKPTLRVIRTPPPPAQWPQWPVGDHPPGVMAMVTPASSGLMVTFSYNTVGGYVPFMVAGLFGTSGTIVLDGPVGGIPGSGTPFPRTIRVN